MKFMIPFLIAMLTVASVAQSQSAVAPGVPSVAIPKTTEVLVIQTPKQGITAQQIMSVPGESHGRGPQCRPRTTRPPSNKACARSYRQRFGQL
jgi:hypothetical protein